MSAQVTAARIAAASSVAPLQKRRVAFAALVAGTIAAMIWLMARALAPGGLDVTDIVLITSFAVALPWVVIGFWNATIGLFLMPLCDDPVAAVFPAARLSADEPIAASTAILLCIRNENPDRAIRNLEPLLGGLVEVGMGGRFHLYVLSDTSDEAIAAEEDLRFDKLQAAWQDRIAVTYRRRRSNDGFKAGNIADFCARWGDRHDFALTLDADSVIPASAALRLVRVIAADPKIGILQGLVVGLPSTSAFTRLFQFGMRLGMRSYTLGSAWWQGDCGPYWGHNAVLRLKPFIAHCELSALPDGGPLAGHVLSHDQIEAVLMRRAKYEVRVWPEENLGFEENPPTLLEFVRRDLRWCQGNMQYWSFIGLPGLHVVSRCQLALAILMFLGSPAWILLLLTGVAALALAPRLSDLVDAAPALVLFWTMLLMWFAPQIATAIEVLLRPSLRRSFGGAPRFMAGLAAALSFNLLLAPIMWLAHVIFLAGLPFGRAPSWNSQQRDDHIVPAAQAARLLWPQTLLGFVVIAVVAVAHPAALPYALVLAGGLAIAAPFAIVTARPELGRLMMRLGLASLPEEIAPPAALRTIALPALQGASAAAPLSQSGLSECSGASRP